MRHPLARLTISGNPVQQNSGSRAIKTSECALVFAADDNFTEGLAVAIHSALKHLPPGVSPEIYLLDNGLSEESHARLRRTVAAARRDVDLRRVQIPGHRLGPMQADSHLRPATYARVLIPEVLPPHIRRVVYLDSDVLVRRDVSPLFSIELGGALLGAVRDYFTSSTAHELSGVRDRSNPRPYFNAGVLVIDVIAWRTAGLVDRVLEYARSGEPLRWADQDALNGVVEDWYELDARWNVQHVPTTIFRADFPLVLDERGEAIYGERRSNYRASAIVHFIGSVKPWHYSCAAAGTYGWVCGLIRSRWYTPRETVVWLVRWHRPRLRYWVGRWRKRLRTRGGLTKQDRQVGRNLGKW